MQARLIVRNFGPIEDVDLDLRNVNVFIGPQASGKSALAKIYTICKSPLSFYDDGTAKSLNGLNGKQSNRDRFKKILEDYNVGSFLNEETYISFSSELHDLTYSKDEIVYDRKIFKKIEELEVMSEDLEMNRERINEILINLFENITHPQFYFKVYKKGSYSDENGYIPSSLKSDFNNEELISTIEKLKNIENDLSSNLALYIPAERNFITIIKGAALNLLNNNVPIPKHILSFGAEFEKASNTKKELDLNFLKKGLVYKNENGIDRIYYSEGKSIRLTEAASGLQSIVPLLLPILSDIELNRIGHKSFIIEEPELNLFPKAQYELIKVLEKDSLYFFSSQAQDIGKIHTYTTHSPYILSALNNLLYANKVEKELARRALNENKEVDADIVAFAKVRNVLPVSINPEYFSAYQICDGEAESIFNREKGLIEDNYIDQATDTMGDDFDALMELMEQE